MNKGQAVKIAEQVTFGGSGLERAGLVRDKPDDIARLKADPDARALVFWRGKPLLTGQDHNIAGLLPMDHPVLAEAKGPIFLGMDESGPRFAYDISAWEPAELPDTLNAFLDASVIIHPEIGDTMAFHELRAAMTHLSPRDAEMIVSALAVLSWHRSHRFCSQCGRPSVMDQAGWRRICPDCGGLHFPQLTRWLSC